MAAGITVPPGADERGFKYLQSIQSSASIEVKFFINQYLKKLMYYCLYRILLHWATMTVH